MKLKYISYFFVAFAIFTIGSTIYGIINNYSGIPYWDEWDAYLGFYNKMQVGGNTLCKAFFEQHNEHKIFFSRILFWIGFTFFKGDLCFQLLMNILIQLSTCAVFFYIIWHQNLQKEFKIILYSIVIIFCFSWIQESNFTMIQSGLIGVNTNAILAYFVIYQYDLTKNKKYYFISYLFIFLTCFSFANGVFAILVFMIFVWYGSIPLKHKIALNIFCLVNITFYLYDFHQILGHSSISDSILNHPFEVINYLLRYLGAPIKHLLNSTDAITDVFGGFFLILFFYSIFLLVKNKIKHNYNIIFIAFSLFVILSGFITATGRIKFGIDQALSGRYSNPVLLGWICLILFYFIETSQTFIKNNILGILFFVALTFSCYQIRYYDQIKYNNLVFNRKEAFLGFRMGLSLPNFTTFLYPAPKDTLNFVELIKNKIVPFDLKPNYIWNANVLSNRYIDLIQKIDVNKNVYTIRGWAYLYKTNKAPSIIGFVNKINGNIIGYAICGSSRKDVKNVFNCDEYVGFQGYITDSVDLLK